MAHSKFPFDTTVINGIWQILKEQVFSHVVVTFIAVRPELYAVCIAGGEGGWRCEHGEQSVSFMTIITQLFTFLPISKIADI